MGAVCPPGASLPLSRPPKGGYRGVKKAAGVVALPGAERSCRCPKGSGSVRSVGVRHMPSPTASNEYTHKGWHGCRAAKVPGTRRLGDGGWVSNTARRATALPLYGGLRNCMHLQFYRRDT